MLLRRVFWWTLPAACCSDLLLSKDGMFRLGDALINGCIADPALCTAAAFNAGTALPSARLFEKLPKVQQAPLNA